MRACVQWGGMKWSLVSLAFHWVAWGRLPSLLDRSIPTQATAPTTPLTCMVLVRPSGVQCGWLAGWLAWGMWCVVWRSQSSAHAHPIESGELESERATDDGGASVPDARPARPPPPRGMQIVSEGL